MVFEVTPRCIDRVELGRVGGQELKSNGTTLSLNVSAHGLGSVRLHAIPDEAITESCFQLKLYCRTGGFGPRGAHVLARQGLSDSR